MKLLQKIKWVIWPQVTTLEGAAKAAGQGVAASLIQAIITGVGILLAITNIIPPYVDLWNTVDIILILFIAYAIYHKSRLASLSALGMVLINTILAFQTELQQSLGITDIIFCLAYVNAIRGTFAWHDQQMKLNPGVVQPFSRLGKIIATICILIAIVCGASFSYLATAPPDSYVYAGQKIPEQIRAQLESHKWITQDTQIDYLLLTDPTFTETIGAALTEKKLIYFVTQENGNADASPIPYTMISDVFLKQDMVDPELQFCVTLPNNQTHTITLPVPTKNQQGRALTQRLKMHIQNSQK